MGLYDTIKCKMKLPLPEELFGMRGVNFNKDLDYQTKDLGQFMRRFEIGEDGILRLSVMVGVGVGIRHLEPYPVDDGEISMLDIYDTTENGIPFRYRIRYTIEFKSQKITQIKLTEFIRKDNKSNDNAIRKILGENPPNKYEMSISFIFRKWRQMWSRVPSSYVIENFFKGYP